MNDKTFRLSRQNIFELSILAALCCVFLVGGLYGYFNHYFAGDGFISYQWARNLGSGLGNFEGPTFEHPWGSHSYLTFILFVPLVKLIGSPIALLLASWVLYSGSVFYLYFWAKEELHECSAPLAFAITLGYLMHPLTGEGMSGFLWSFFQPEVQFPLAIIVAITSFFRGHQKLCVAALIYLVLGKEEYIIVVPALIFWSVVSSKLLGKPIRFHLRTVTVGLCLYLAASSLARLTLSHFRELNVYDHITRNADLGSVIPWQDFLMLKQLDLGILANAIYASAVFIPLLILALIKLKWRPALVWLMTFCGFVVLRLITDRYLYGPGLHTLQNVSPGLAWANWARLIIPTMLALTSVLVAKGLMPSLKKQPYVSYGLVTSMVAMSVYYWYAWPPVPVFALRDQSPFVQSEITLSQKRQIAEKTKEIVTNPNFGKHPYKSIVLIPATAWEQFFPHMTLAQYNSSGGFDAVWTTEQGKRFKEQALFIVVEKKDLKEESLTRLNEYNVISETEDYFLLRRDETIAPLISRDWRYW